MIVNSQRPVTALAELEPDELALAVEVWRERMRAHPQAACLHLFVNEGAAGGSSRPHTHAQLLALDFVPALIARERERFGAYAAQTMGQQLLDDLVSEEVRRRERIVAVDEEAVLLVPLRGGVALPADAGPARARACASRTTARPARRCCTTRWRDSRGASARALRSTSGSARPRAAPSTSAGGSTSSRGSATLAGLELGSGLHLTSVAPEQAAAELREA